ncbi:MAG: ArsI/CadI family heavy metal resistance metalloenzyme [Pseudohongiellaceae bacterium]
MTRLHIHVGVSDLEQAIGFYSALFGVAPSKTKDDYAKWMLDDPRLNFAISTRVTPGVDHLGIQAEEEAEMTAMRERFQAADLSLFDEGDTACCYARSDKSWLRDPAGIAWETFRTMEDVQQFGGGGAESVNACCVPATETTKACCAGDA